MLCTTPKNWKHWKGYMRFCLISIGKFSNNYNTNKNDKMKTLSMNVLFFVLGGIPNHHIV